MQFILLHKMRVFVLLAILALGLAEKVRYDGYQMWELSLNSEEDGHFLKDLEEKRVILDVDGALKSSGKALITLSPKQCRVVGEYMMKRGISYTVMEDDIQKLFDAEAQRYASRCLRSGPGALAYDPNDFNTVEDNYAHMQEYIESCSSRGLSCSVENAGDSYEGRPMNIYKVSSGGNKPIIWLDSVIHAREWLALTTTVRIFDFLIENYGSNPEVTDILDRYDFHFMPVVNPDGYAYSWTNDRMQRKNRRPQDGSCVDGPPFGVDLNRNFDHNWCRQGASSLVCSDTFCGPSAGSEPETQHYKNAVAAVTSRIAALVTVHTYGQMWMHPWSNTIGFGPFNPCERGDDHDDMFAAASAAADGIFQVSGRRWDVGTICEVIYAATGGVVDWAKDQGVKYPFAPELRSTFTAPPSEIEPSFREVWRGLIMMMDKIEEIEGYGFPLKK